MTADPSDSDLENLEEVSRLASYAKWSINIISGALVLYFAWLELKGVELAKYVNTANPETLLKSAIVLFYLCWLFGANFDLRLQQATFLRDPFHGKFSLTAIVLLSVFGAASFVLVWASYEEVRFAITLTIWSVIANIGGIYIQRRIRPIIKSSWMLTVELDDYYRYERLLIAARFLIGRWQLARAVLCVVLLIGVDVVVLSNSAREATANVIAQLWPAVTADSVVRLLPGASFLAYVLIT